MCNLRTGAEVARLPPVSITNPQHHVNVARRMAAQRSDAFFADQFENLANLRAHLGTGKCSGSYKTSPLRGKSAVGDVLSSCRFAANHDDYFECWCIASDISRNKSVKMHRRICVHQQALGTRYSPRTDHRQYDVNVQNGVPTAVMCNPASVVTYDAPDASLSLNV